jgi:hypothetical protein
LRLGLQNNFAPLSSARQEALANKATDAARF